MHTKEMRDAVKELMNKYNDWKTKWVGVHGSTDGFDAWFTAQVNRAKEQ